MEITSKTNTKVKQWMKYHQKKYRDQDGCFLIEGEHLIEEALMENLVEALMIRNGNVNHFTYNGPIYELADEVMDKLSMNVSKVNYMALCSKIDKRIKHKTRVLLLDDIQDPGNLGTIVRTAHSFGFDIIYASKNCVDLYNEKTIRSTQGALFHVPYEQISLEEIIVQLKQDGFKVFATSLHNAIPLSKAEECEKLAIVLGNEGSGVHDHIIDLCDTSIKIEMNAFESLNVAVAGGICMYYFRKK